MVVLNNIRYRYANIRELLKANRIEAFCIVIIGVGIVEAVWGVLQMIGIVPSGHPRYAVTGSFYNPGPFGCFMGSIFPLAVWLYVSHKTKLVKCVAVIYIMLSVLLLPGGMSRTGWIAAIAGSILVLIGKYKHRFENVGITRLSSIIVFGCVIVTLCCYGVYLLKPDSADGRILMWKIATKAMTDAPLMGVGWDSVGGAYGEAQEAYFAGGEATDREAMLAGSPVYVFNEFLQIGIAYGIPSAVLFLFSLTFSVWRYWRKGQYGLSGLSLALIITCMASYPLQFAIFKILIGVVVTGALFLIENKVIRLVGLLLWGGTWMLFCIRARPVDSNSLFNRAWDAHQIGRYETSNRLLHIVLSQTSNPMPLYLMSRNYQLLNLSDSAEYCLRRATYRAPNLCYPHYLLMKFYEAGNQSSLAKNEACLLLLMRPKIESDAIEQMRYSAARYLYKHELEK